TRTSADQGIKNNRSEHRQQAFQHARLLVPSQTPRERGTESCGSFERSKPVQDVKTAELPRGGVSAIDGDSAFLSGLGIKGLEAGLVPHLRWCRLTNAEG